MVLTCLYFQKYNEADQRGQDLGGKEDMFTGLAGGGLEKRKMKNSLTFSTLGVSVAEMKEAWVKS